MQTRIINALAPVRICDNGGWTDTWFAEYGKVVSIAVQPGVRVQVRVVASEFNATGLIDPLLRAVIDALPPPLGVHIAVSTASVIPPGSSTGTSAAVSVALIGALLRVRGEERSPLDIARLAHEIETKQAGRQCGVQDQIAAAYGGVNYIEITRYPDYSVTPLRISDFTQRELNARLTLVDVGKAHCSTTVHQMVIHELEGEGSEAPRLRPLREAAERSRAALTSGNLQAFGKAMIDNTEAQRQLHPEIVGAAHQRIIDLAKANGAWGWKVNGAGGDGGSITVLHGPELKDSIDFRNLVQSEGSGMKVLPVHLDTDGVKVWESVPEPC